MEAAVLDRPGPAEPTRSPALTPLEGHVPTRLWPIFFIAATIAHALGLLEVDGQVGGLRSGSRADPADLHHIGTG